MDGPRATPDQLAAQQAQQGPGSFGPNNFQTPGPAPYDMNTALRQIKIQQMLTGLGTLGTTLTAAGQPQTGAQRAQVYMQGNRAFQNAMDPTQAFQAALMQGQLTSLPLQQKLLGAQADVAQQQVGEQEARNKYFDSFGTGTVSPSGPSVHPVTGRPIVNNADGSFSTERSITVTDPSLNDGRPTNIPSMWGGRELPQPEAIKQALQSGQKFESFGSIDEAVTAAKQRSTMLGNTASPAPSQAAPLFTPEEIKMYRAMPGNTGLAALAAETAKRRERVTTLTDAEVKGMGLPQGTIVQRDQTGKLSITKGDVISEAALAQKMAERAAGKTDVNVKVDTAQELATNKAYGEHVGAHYGKLYTGVQEAGKKAIDENSRMDAISSLMDQANTGTGSGAILAAKRAGQMLGVDIGNPGPGEAGQALAREFALQMRNPAGGAGMPGQLSDSDRVFLESMTGGLSMTKPGRDLLFETRRRMNARTQEIAKMARVYQKDHGAIDAGFEDEIQKYADAHPLFKDLADKVPKVALPSATPSATRPRAVNPNTGATVEFDGTTWVPVQ